MGNIEKIFNLKYSISISESTIDKLKSLQNIYKINKFPDYLFFILDININIKNFNLYIEKFNDNI